MDLFHFLNFQKYPRENGQSVIPNLDDNFQKLLKLSENWVEPAIRFEKLIFSNLAAARQFLSGLPGTPWSEYLNQELGENCDENCHQKELIKFQQASPVGLDTIYMITSLTTAYELERLLKPLGEYRSTVQSEILCLESTALKEDLTLFIEEIYPQLHLKTPSRFSLLHAQFEISYQNGNNANRGKKRKRTRKPPETFQRDLKRLNPALFPNTVGNDYYGRSVFQAFVNLYQNQLNQINVEDPTTIDHFDLLEKTIPLPPSPMKWFDLQEQEGSIELRFKDYIPISVATLWWQHLMRVLSMTDEALEMIRISCTFDAWQDEINYKTARSDQFFFTYNDFELALKQRNHFVLSSLSDGKIIQNLGTIYFRLSSLIDPEDFRIQKIENIFEKPTYLR